MHCVLHASTTPILLYYILAIGTALNHHVHEGAGGGGGYFSRGMHDNFLKECSGKG